MQALDVAAADSAEERMQLQGRLNTAQVPVVSPPCSSLPTNTTASPHTHLCVCAGCWYAYVQRSCTKCCMLCMQAAAEERAADAAEQLADAQQAAEDAWSQLQQPESDLERQLAAAHEELALSRQAAEEAESLQKRAEEAEQVDWWPLCLPGYMVT